MPGLQSALCNHVAFNQDSTCISIANDRGIFVYSLDCDKVVYTKWLGSIKLCKMLFSTSLLAYVGTGEQVKLTPRKLSLLNTTTETPIQDLNFQTSVIAVLMNRQRLVAVLEHRVIVYALDTLQMISTLETLPNPDSNWSSNLLNSRRRVRRWTTCQNPLIQWTLDLRLAFKAMEFCYDCTNLTPQGVSALTSVTDPCYLAVPSQSNVGCIRVCNAAEGNHILAELGAHKSGLAALAWNSNGTLLASASDKGTVLRVHSFPQASKVFTFRRGTTQAGINCLAFSAEGVSPQLLACASSHGTVHLWNLERPSTFATRTSSGLLASVIPSSMTDYVDPQRCIVNLRLPAGVPRICAIQAKKTSSAASQMMERAASGSAEGVTVLSVVTEDAILYTYHIDSFAGNQTPTFALHDERHLLSKTNDAILQTS